MFPLLTNINAITHPWLCKCVINFVLKIINLNFHTFSSWLLTKSNGFIAFTIYIINGFWCVWCIKLSVHKSLSSCSCVVIAILGCKIFDELLSAMSALVRTGRVNHFRIVKIILVHGTHLYVIALLKQQTGWANSKICGGLSCKFIWQYLTPWTCERHFRGWIVCWTGVKLSPFPIHSIL